VTSESACRLACEIENEFLCRSFIYKGPPAGAAYNCELFHLDHKTLPDGPSTYLNAERPLIDDGQKIGNYYENYCESESRVVVVPPPPPPALLCGPPGGRPSLSFFFFFFFIESAMHSLP